MARFNFIGEFTKSKDEEKFIARSSEKNSNRSKINFGVKTSGTNIGYVTLFGMTHDVINTRNVNNEQIEIDWENRFDPDEISKVSNSRKFFVNLDEEHNVTFINSYDMVEYLAEVLPSHKGKIKVIGDFKRRYYNGKPYDSYEIQSVYAAREDEKPKLTVTFDIFYNKESLDKSDVKDKKVFLNGYFSQYIDKPTGTKYLPQTFVFDFTKYDLNQEKHKKLYDYKMKYLTVGKNDMHHLKWETRLFNGSEDVEMTEDMLTDAQREQIELGIRTLDDFKPSKGVLGEKVKEFRLADPQLKGEFGNGLVEAFSNSEFEDLIYNPKANSEPEVVRVTAVVDEIIESSGVEEDDIF